MRTLIMRFHYKKKKKLCVLVIAERSLEAVWGRVSHYNAKQDAFPMCVRLYVCVVTASGSACLLHCCRHDWCLLLAADGGFGLVPSCLVKVLEVALRAGGAHVKLLQAPELHNPVSRSAKKNLLNFFSSGWISRTRFGGP